MKKSFVPQSVLKQKARQLKKEKSLTQHRALDEAAIFYGFSNYKNYLNMSEANRKNRETSKEMFLEEMSLEKQSKIAEKLKHTNLHIQKLKISVLELLVTLKQSQLSEKAIQSICENTADLKKYVDSHLLKDALEDEGAEIEMFAPYHIAKEILLKNLVYRLDEGGLSVEGDFYLSLEFAFNYDPTEKDDFFNDRAMSGDFEISIDRNCEVTFENSSIGEEFEGGIYEASF